MIPPNIKDRLPSGKLFKLLIEVKKLKDKNNKSDLVEFVYYKLLKKFWLGKTGIKYADIVEVIWNNLISNNQEGETINLRGVKFQNDHALISEYSEIFLCDLFEDFTRFHDENLIAAQLLPLFTKDGPYQFENVLLKSGDIVIDAGANLGLFSIFAKLKGVEKIYAFEPQKNLNEMLTKNIGLNKFDNFIKIQPIGLSDQSQTTELISDPKEGHISASLLRRKSENSIIELIQCITLDEWVTQNKISKIDFIKADIEGSERKMLTGATNVLKVFAPNLAICTYHLPDDPIVLENIIMNANSRYKIKHFGNKLFAHV